MKKRGRENIRTAKKVTEKTGIIKKGGKKTRNTKKGNRREKMKCILNKQKQREERRGEGIIMQEKEIVCEE